jgi:peptidoglycan/LPS O-acetylase OafA/YrhL
MVLAAHFLPLGPNPWQLNVSAGILGMSFFFTLSGFLITHFLLNHSSILDFLIRRFFRIIPLAWAYLAVVLFLYHASSEAWLAHFFFYANYPPKPLLHVTDHFWSLCVEIQFYIGIALLVAIFKKRGLYILPALCLLVTLCRVENEAYFSVMTHLRVDEILAGSTLALIYNEKLGSWFGGFLERINYPAIIILLLISCHPSSGFMNYFRPYLATLLVGSTIYNQRTNLTRVLGSRHLAYIASISYALYILHPLLADSWLGSGDHIEKYVKRPILFAVVFLLSHVSTYYYEHKWIAFAKHLSHKWRLNKQL